MTEPMRQIGKPANAFRRGRNDGSLRRAIVVLVAAIALGACGGASSPGALGSPKPYFHTSYSGMMSNKEPDEGAIPSGGRTYRGSVRPLNDESVAGVQLLLGNMTRTPIRGAKLLVGISTNFNSEQLPAPNGTVNNVITNNLNTGWVKVKIGGSDELPVPASEDGEDGAGLAWTDLIPIANSFTPGDFEIVWRMWVPERAKAPYARTYSETTSRKEIDGSITYGLPNEKVSAIRGLSVFEYDVRGWNFWQDSSYMHYGYTNGDAVTSPSVSKTWATTPPPPNHYNAYSHVAQPTQGGNTVPAVAAIPVLGFRWKATRSLPVIEMVGDSIMQGYHDRVGDHIVTVDGVPGRLIRALGSGKTAKYTFINFGQSGWTPEQYLARWKGLARADTSGATAVVYSIYSPNGSVEWDFSDPEMVRMEELKANCVAAEQAARDYGRIFIPAFITGTNAFALRPVYDQNGEVIRYSSLAIKELLRWATERYGDQLLDLHSAVQPTGAASTDGPSMAAAYTSDQTHPNWDGYDALGKKAVEIFDGVYTAARAAQMAK